MRLSWLIVQHKRNSPTWIGVAVLEFMFMETVDEHRAEKLSSLLPEVKTGNLFNTKNFQRHGFIPCSFLL